MNQRLDLSDPRIYFGDYVPRILAERIEFREQFLGVQATAQVEVTGQAGGIWHFVINDSDISIYEGSPPHATFTVQLSIDTFRQLREKSLTPQNAFLRGRIRLGGKVATAMKLATLMRS